jgi:enoyl-CoA hydratase/carnithine racemase
MELSSHNSVAVLTFPLTAGYPRLTAALLGEIDALLDEVQGAGLFSGMVIAANAKSFATGAEIEEVSVAEGLRAREFAERGQSTCCRLANFPLPVVAAIRGYCLGGGLDLALACHGRVATYDASFGHPGAARGLVTGWGGTQRLPRLLGKATALQMLLSADRIPASQALSMGLVDELVSSRDLLSAAARRAQALRRVPPAQLSQHEFGTKGL